LYPAAGSEDRMRYLGGAAERLLPVLRARGEAAHGERAGPVADGTPGGDVEDGR